MIREPLTETKLFPRAWFDKKRKRCQLVTDNIDLLPPAMGRSGIGWEALLGVDQVEDDASGGRQE